MPWHLRMAPKRGRMTAAERMGARRLKSCDLRGASRRALIVAHKEDVSELVRTLSIDGFIVKVFRGPYTGRQEAWTRAMKCLANHANAWRFCLQAGEPCIVCEADFTPCTGFGRLPLPCPPPGTPDAGHFAYLYSPGSVLYGRRRDHYVYGHGNTMVCYYITPHAAQALLEFYERETSSADGTYKMWDTYLGVFLRWERGILNYFTELQYGEHGGLPNPEHRVAGIRDWHRADALAAPLAFAPLYGRGRGIGRTAWERFRGRIRGAGRILSLRYYDPRSIDADQRQRHLAFAALRRLVYSIVPAWLAPVMRWRPRERHRIVR